MDQTITLTFGDQAENHVGMQQIGTLGERGFSQEELEMARDWFVRKNVTCQLFNLTDLLPPDVQSDDPNAYILIARGGINALLSEEGVGPTDDGDNTQADAMFREQAALPADTKAFMYGRVVNKHARYNLCFAKEGQEPNYAEGRGRIVPLSDVPITARAYARLAEVLGPEGGGLAIEGNYYFNPSVCGIGFHGDTERKKVVGMRLGATMPLVYSWFVNGAAVPNTTITFELNHGDLYIMTQKTCGFDWRQKKIPTLRHAAGCAKYTALPTTNRKKEKNKEKEPAATATTTGEKAPKLKKNAAMQAVKNKFQSK